MKCSFQFCDARGAVGFRGFIGPDDGLYYSTPGYEASYCRPHAEMVARAAASFAVAACIDADCGRPARWDGYCVAHAEERRIEREEEDARQGEASVEEKLRRQIAAGERGWAGGR